MQDIKNKSLRNFLRYGLLCIFTLLVIPFGFSQSTEYLQANHYLNSRGEVYFRFISDKINPEELSNMISIDKINGDTTFAYASREEFDNFLQKNYQYTILTPPSFLPDGQKFATDAFLKDWDAYPTYDAYVDMMNSFAANYPDICRVYEIGTSVNGRKLLCVKISDNVDTKEPEPEFFYTSTMHGDEVTGYILLLRLTDYLLSNYGTIPSVQQLIDNLEIWINPNSNPDGTYFSGNHTVSGATRYNANSVDLNRNFPDPDDGDHPDGNDWQPETVAMMLFMTNHRFIFSANYHGGSEVMNYPWDTWSKPHPDENWFEYVSQQYADTVKKYGGSSYFSDVEADGVTNGYDWYPIAGGRQDYTTYFCHGREITIEVSIAKMPPPASLPTYWDYNRQAMLDYMGQCLKGIHGIVTDSVTGEPLKAKIVISDHDADSSHVYSDSMNGDYHRLIAPGTYTVQCIAPGYKVRTSENIIIDSWTSYQELNFALSAGTNPVEMLTGTGVDKPEIWIGADRTLYFYLQTPQQVAISIYSVQGILIKNIDIQATTGKNSISFENESLSNGLYICKIHFNKNNSKVLKIQF